MLSVNLKIISKKLHSSFQQRAVDNDQTKCHKTEKLYYPKIINLIQCR